MRRALAAVLVALAAVAGCDVPALSSSPVAVPAASGGESAVVDGPLADFLTEHARRVQVERVVDGDTIAVTGDERVRLLTINAPELRAFTRADDADCGAEAARDALAQLLPVGTEVALNGLKGEPAQDRYGRTLSDVYVQQGDQLVNVSLWMVAEGRARVYDAYPTSESEVAAALQGDAQAARRGVWSAC